MTEILTAEPLLGLANHVARPVLTLKPDGELDASNATVLDSVSLDLEPFEHVTQVVIDLADLTFCDLTGRRALGARPAHRSAVR